jgi:hypothetical protein
MDWSYKFENLQNEIKCLSERADKLAQAYADAEDFTRKFLTQCSKHHIKLVSIGMRTELIDGCKDYPFDTHGSVFAEGRTKDGWSSIWEVVSELDISGGAGNKFQHQVSYEAEVKLVDGVYEFKDKKWHKIR